MLQQSQTHNLSSQTSYLCLLSFSLWSYLIASRLFSHSRSSFAFSLKTQTRNQTFSEQSITSPSFITSVTYGWWLILDALCGAVAVWSGPRLTSACPRSDCRCSGACICPPWSSSSFLSLSASCLSSVQPGKVRLVNTLHKHCRLLPCFIWGWSNDRRKTINYFIEQLIKKWKKVLPSAGCHCILIPCCSVLSSSWPHPQPSCGRQRPPSSASQPEKQILKHISSISNQSCVVSLFVFRVHRRLNSRSEM